MRSTVSSFSVGARYIPTMRSLFHTSVFAVDKSSLDSEHAQYVLHQRYLPSSARDFPNMRRNISRQNYVKILENFRKL